MKNEKFRKASITNIIKYKVLWFLGILEDLVEEVKELF
nr:MAG TPA: hypothetical protein [Caudoviricetes sp.]DAR89108.1 MAG TPA: hypothetical protein [Caudoviricetes sp.]